MIDWRALADGHVHVLRRGVDFAHPVDAAADLAKVAAGRLGKTAIVMVDNLGSYELVWVQFADVETGTDEPCPECGSLLLPRSRVLARCSGCRKLVLVRSRKERASPEAIALLDKALGRSPASAKKLRRGEPKPPKAERRRKGERPPKAERPRKVEHAPKGERQSSPERLMRRDQRSARSELTNRYGRRLEDFAELDLFFDEDESEATVERYYGHGIDPSGNVSIIRVDFPVDESGQRLPDVRHEGEDVYKLLVMPLSTFERLGDARFGTDDDLDDDL